jgi:hypothetical protein
LVAIGSEGSKSVKEGGSSVDGEMVIPSAAGVVEFRYSCDSKDTGDVFHESLALALVNLGSPVVIIGGCVVSVVSSVVTMGVCVVSVVSSVVTIGGCVVSVVIAVVVSE